MLSRDLSSCTAKTRLGLDSYKQTHQPAKQCIYLSIKKILPFGNNVHFTLCTPIQRCCPSLSTRYVFYEFCGMGRLLLLLLLPPPRTTQRKTSAITSCVVRRPKGLVRTVIQNVLQDRTPPFLGRFARWDGLFHNSRRTSVFFRRSMLRFTKFPTTDFFFFGLLVLARAPFRAASQPF